MKENNRIYINFTKKASKWLEENTIYRWVIDGSPLSRFPEIDRLDNQGVLILYTHKPHFDFVIGATTVYPTVVNFEDLEENIPKQFLKK